MPLAPNPGSPGRGLLFRSEERPAPTAYHDHQDREYLPVTLRLVEGTLVEGLLSLPPSKEGVRIRPYDLLERQTERILRLIDARVRNGQDSYPVRSIAVNKSSVAYMHEIDAIPQGATPTA